MASNPAAEVRGRLLAYLATALVVVALAGLVGAAEWRTNADVHALHETAATLLALLVGSLALVRHYSRRERIFLVIGATFLGTAALDAFHAIVTFLAPPEDTAGVNVFAPWSWFASRTFLALFLFRLSLLPRPKFGRRGAPVREVAVIGVAIALVLSAILVLTLVPLPPPYRPGFPLGRPLELIPAVLLLSALVLQLRMRNWKRNVFEHWLVLSLIVGFAGEALFMARSTALYDRWFDAAHLLRTSSYACVLAGLLTSVFFAYRRLEENRRGLAAANATLQRLIEERAAVERDLRIRTAYLEQLIESAPEGIVVVDERDRVLRANAEFTTMFGYTAAEAVGRTIAELIVQEEAARESQAVTRAVASGLTVGYEAVRRRRNGSLVDVSILATPIRGAEGHTAVYGIYRDITDRKRAEQAKKESAHRLAAVIDAAPVGIVTLDAAGTVRTWNHAAARLLGIPARQVLGRPLPLLADDPDTLHALDLALEGGVVAGIVIQRDSAGAAAISLTTAPLHDGAGQPDGTLIIVAVATARETAERGA